jgi:hypothetical protein
MKIRLKSFVVKASFAFGATLLIAFSSFSNIASVKTVSASGEKPPVSRSLAFECSEVLTMTDTDIAKREGVDVATIERFLNVFRKWCEKSAGTGANNVGGNVGGEVIPNSLSIQPLACRGGEPAFALFRGFQNGNYTGTFLTNYSAYSSPFFCW